MLEISSNRAAAEDTAPSSSSSSSRVERLENNNKNNSVVVVDDTDATTTKPLKKKVSVTRFINGKKTKVEVDAEELEEKEQAYKESKKKKSRKIVPTKRPSLVPVREDALVRGLSKLKDLIGDDDDDSDQSDHDDVPGPSTSSSPQRRRGSKIFHYSLPAFPKQQQPVKAVTAEVDDDSDISDDDDDDDDHARHSHETLEKRHEVEDDDEKAGTGQSLNSKNHNGKSANHKKTDKYFHYTLPAFEKGVVRGGGAGGGDEHQEESIRLEDDYNELEHEGEEEEQDDHTRSTQLYGKSLSALGMDQATTKRKESFSLDKFLNSSAYGNGNSNNGNGSSTSNGSHIDHSTRTSFDGDQSVSSAFFHQEQQAPVKSGIVPIQDIQISVVTGTLSPALQDKVKNRKKEKDLEKLKSANSNSNNNKNKSSSSSSSKIVPGARSNKTSSSSKKSSPSKGTAAPLLLSPSGKRKSFTVEAYSTQKKAADQKVAAEQAKKKAAVIEAQRKKLKELEKKLAKIEKEKQKQLKELRVDHETQIKQLDKDHQHLHLHAQLGGAAKKQHSKLDSKDSDDETKAAKKNADATVQSLTNENKSLLEQRDFMKQTLAMAVEQRKILDRQAVQLQTKQDSLQQWVERKTRYKAKKEKASRDCVTTYIPNHKHELQEANKYCKAEYIIKKLYKTMMEQMVTEVNEKSKDRALAKEIRHLSKDCKKDVKALDKAPMPEDLKAFLEF
jgi:hypothetical protein